MNILVCISSVPDTTSSITFSDENTKFNQDGITFIINPYDEFCLTKAVFIKESLGATITALNVGNNKNDAILRKALAIGADKAARINQDPTSSKIVADCIANYCSQHTFDLIFCGTESIDYNGGQVPGYIASNLKIPFINGCIGLEIEGSILNLKRTIDNGHEICTSTLPTLIAGQKGLVEEKELRIPSMRGIMTARTKPLEVIESSLIDESSIRVLKYEKPLARSECKIIEDNNVKSLVELLQSEAKVI